MQKQPFDIDVVMQRVAEAVRPFPKAALFQLADEGYDSPFEQAVACVISQRELDEVTVEIAPRLLDRARTPAKMAHLTTEEIENIIHSVRYHDVKAGWIHGIACVALEQYGGDLPCQRDALRALKGIGPKCANLVLGVACREPAIAVDVHVQRVTNRWGYVHGRTPEQTLEQLEAKLPRRYWTQLNELLVPFGKHICTSRLPHCSTCPVLAMCRQIGVTAHR